MVLVGFLLGAATVRADATVSAREHFKRGTTLYDLQRFHEAAREYAAAFEMRDDPALLFNIGQAYRFGGEHAEAIGAFRAYLRRLPHADNRAEVEARIVELKALYEARKKAEEKPPAGTLTPADARPDPRHADAAPPPVALTPAPPPVPTVPRGDFTRARRLKIGGLVAGVVGLGLGGGGIACAVLARQTADRINHAAPGSGVGYDPKAAAAGARDQALGLGLLAGGGAALVAGVVSYALGVRERQRARAWSLVPSVTPQAASLSLTLGF